MELSVVECVIEFFLFCFCLFLWELRWELWSTGTFDIFSWWGVLLATVRGFNYMI